MAAGSPSARLFNTLLVTMSAILLGVASVRLKLLEPNKGHLESMAVFTGQIAFPLLIFNTIATAELQALDVGVIGACSLGKVVVLLVAWFLTYFAFRPERSRGQRILTASVFAFFAVASDDFAIGFPVIDALYGKVLDMGVYIAGNALVGSFVFVPVTMTALAIGGVLKKNEGISDGGASSKLHICLTILRDLFTNPVLLMTCAGLLYKLLLGSTLIQEGGKTKLPHPLCDLIELFTAPFTMCALFLTGTSLRSARLSFWPCGLVLLKVVVCAYLSYAFGALLVADKADGVLTDFTFFYGAIPTGSPPIVFAGLFDPDSTELVATAVLFGLILAGPIMFVTSFMLGAQSLGSAREVLNDVQLSADVASLVCGALFLVLLAALRGRWNWRCPVRMLLACYGLVLVAYNVSSLFFAIPVLQDMNCPAAVAGQRSPVILCFTWLQNTASILLLMLQFALVYCGSHAHSHPGNSWMPALLCFLMALLPTLFAAPNTIYEICRRTEHGSLTLMNLLWSCLKLMICLVLALFAIWQKAHPTPCSLADSEDLSPSEDEEEASAEEAGAADTPAWYRLIPRGVLKVLTTMNMVKILTQVVNASQVYLHGRQTSGSFAAMLVLESVLEHGQALVLFVALLFDGNFTAMVLDLCVWTQSVWCLPTAWKKRQGRSPQLGASVNPFAITVASIPQVAEEEVEP